ncbi:alpha-hydroxy acid oxidase [Aurantimonas sp. VKM B-3413]|uniref:alpha-hydroxy acid oxidase n=1 Tax=Aurantimonas sp. VKM B-3413 TaxID=2779401 RepID=UPI001E2DA05E|nr:alpha-hydroxy acid oxidase [Aurantimonas sp. VKM B-3413]MCB8840536.1 alpha-hydroxy-acid oxidizing protein [Aurantimonas sp. VKM B-3413]
MTRHLISVDDLRQEARRRLPRFAFDFIDGAAGSEAGLRRNRAAFEDAVLRPRALVDVDGDLSTTAELLGREWAMPFGVAPIGLAGLAWPGMDRILAEAAQAAGAPYAASTPATATLESLRRAAPTSAWFQLYVGRSQEIVDDLLARAADAGYDTLIVTVDVPRPGRRRRDLRNRFALPLRYTPAFVWDLVTHPAWSMAAAHNGPPRFANLERYAGASSSAASLAEFQAAQSSGRLDWRLLTEIRRAWKGKLIVKGLLAPSDAARAASEGADAVAVSNHGGRQLDSAPATLQVLPAIRQAVPDGFPLLLDGGVRSGEDIVKALVAGADYVLMGRPFLYAVAARGRTGASDLFHLLRMELLDAMAQMGCRTLQELTMRGSEERHTSFGEQGIMTKR